MRHVQEACLITSIITLPIVQYLFTEQSAVPIWKVILEVPEGSQLLGINRRMI